MKEASYFMGLIFLTSEKGFLFWLKTHLLACPVKQHLGIDCPGCGFQRSVLALFEGNFMSSLKLYPPTIPIIALVLFTLIHLKVDFKQGAFFIKILYIGISLLIVINYIYKIFTHQLS
jgi:phosphoglycerol transferase MdoB-like AlkP superfamily enzyme